MSFCSLYVDVFTTLSWSENVGLRDLSSRQVRVGPFDDRLDKSVRFTLGALLDFVCF